MSKKKYGAPLTEKQCEQHERELIRRRDAGQITGEQFWDGIIELMVSGGNAKAIDPPDKSVLPTVRGERR